MRQVRRWIGALLQDTTRRNFGGTRRAGPPPGEAKLKTGGQSYAGHNGLRDIHAQLGSDRYWRLRLGVGHPGVKAGSRALGIKEAFTGPPHRHRSND